MRQNPHMEPVEIRRLDSVDRQLAGVRLLCAVWGTDSAEDLVGPSMMRALDFAGNYVYGAYLGGELVGVSVAFLGGDHLHSHITGLLPSARAAGLGPALKRHQRDWALERGITRVEWTFDPLVARNAYFNLQKLGAVAVAYLPDFYGAMADGLNDGDATDRLLARWDLTRTGPVQPVAVTAGDRAVEVPRDVESLRRNDPAAAAGWRQRVRDRFQEALADGFRIAGITRDSVYVLRPAGRGPAADRCEDEA